MQHLSNLTWQHPMQLTSLTAAGSYAPFIGEGKNRPIDSCVAPE